MVQDLRRVETLMIVEASAPTSPTSPTFKHFGETSSVSEDSQGGYSIAWKDLAYQVKIKNETEVIMQNMSGLLKPGSVMAVIGASGAGKSTFLDALAGRKPSSEILGSVLINGDPKIAIQRVSRYCTQDDALLGNLTVKETLRFAARFNLEESTSASEVDRIVDNLIGQFGLKKVKDLVIGTPLRKGCSGGQIRRVSTACQMVGMESGILFLDEPTSGLDSVAACQVIACVKALAKRRNSIVIATIHQPSTETFNLFSHLLVMAKGETVYFGKREDAIPYFESIGLPIPVHSNPSDFYLHITNTDFSNSTDLGIDKLNLIGKYAESERALNTTAEIAALKPKSKSNLLILRDSPREKKMHSFTTQISILLDRAVLNALKNPLAYWVRVVMYGALGFIMGTTFLNLSLGQASCPIRISSLFFTTVFLCFMSIAGIPAFLEERLVYIRETDNKLYSVEAYMLANFLIGLPFLALVTLSFGIMAYFLTGYQSSGEHFFRFIGILYMVLIVAEAQQMLISAVFPLFVLSLTISSLLAGLLIVVQGVAVTRESDIKPGWRYTVYYIDFQKYGYEALMKNEFEGLKFQCDPIPNSTFCACLYPTKNTDCTFDGTDVLRYFEYDKVDFKVWITILFAIFVFLKLATYISLKYKIHLQ